MCPDAMRRSLQRLREHFQARPDSEHEQALVRLVIIGIFLLYLLGTAYSDPESLHRLRAVLGVLLLETAVAIRIAIAVACDRRISHPRRWLGIASDFGATAVILHLQGQAVAPLSVLFLWMTIGNGLRFGPDYLRKTTLVSMAAFAAVVATTPYWQQHLPLAGALLLANALIPGRLMSMLHALKRATEAAKSADASKSRFLANMSHELRTPLNGIVVTSGLLGGTPMSREQREYASVIHTSAHALLATVQDVLDLAALQSGKVRIEAADFALRRTLERLRLQFEPVAREKQVALSVEIAGDVPDVLSGSRDFLRRALANLLDNALTTTQTGAVTLTVASFEAGRGRCWLRCEVRDIANGMVQGAHRRRLVAIARPGTGTAQPHGGSGLGTTVARTLAEAMGGSAGIGFGADDRSMAWIRIPFALGSAAPADDSQTLDIASPRGETVVTFDALFVRHRARVLPRRILVADDQPANQLVLARILEKAGHSATIVDDGESALDALAESAHDIALVDLHMPGISGLDLIRRLRVMQSGAAPRTVVVVLSAEADAAVAETSRQAGAFAFLTKPVDVARLLETIADASRTASGLAHQDIDLGVVTNVRGIDAAGDLVHRYVDRCLAEASQCLQRADVAAQERAWSALRSHCRALGESAKNLGAAALGQSAADIDSLPPKRLVREWHAHRATLLAQLQQVERTLGEKLGKLRPQESSESNDATPRASSL